MRLLFIILLIVPSILSADGYKKFFPNDDDFYACKFLTTFETRDAAFKRELEGPKFVERDLDQVFNSGYKEVFSDVGRTFILNNEFFDKLLKFRVNRVVPKEGQQPATFTLIDRSTENVINLIYSAVQPDVYAYDFHYSLDVASGTGSVIYFNRDMFGDDYSTLIRQMYFDCQKR